MQELTSTIRQIALEMGFDAIGFAQAERLNDEANLLTEWLGAGYHADMSWMEGHFEKRVNPTLLVEGTKTVVVVLFSYKPSQQQPAGAPIISKYAYGTDYHIVLKQKLWDLLARIKEVAPDADGRPFVDSAPVLEKAWAARAGLGWVGKNSLLLNRELGSFFFIGTLMLNLELVAAVPIKSYCGSCTRCIDSCPTKAIVSPKVVDARRCISYHTIENRGEIPSEIAAAIDKRIFGCDICQDVCPWNRKPSAHNHPEINPREAILSYSLDDWVAVDEGEFSKIFRNSAVKRTKYTGFKRNLNVAFGSSKDQQDSM